MSGGGGGNNYYENAEKLYGVQADTAQFMLDIGKGRLPGAVDAYTKAATQYSDPAYAARMAGQAGADAEQAIASGTGAMARNLARYGINPNSGRFGSIAGDNAIRGAAIKAGAMNNARRYVEDKKFGAAKDYYSSLVGMNSDAAAQAGQAGGNFAQMGSQAQAKKDNEDAAWGNAIGMGSAYMFKFKDGGSVKMARGGLFGASNTMSPPPVSGTPGGSLPSGVMQGIKAGNTLKDAMSGAAGNKTLGTVSKGLAKMADMTGSGAAAEGALGVAGAGAKQAEMLIAQNAGIEGATAATVDALGAGTAAAGEAAAAASPLLSGAAAAVPWVAAGAAIGKIFGLFADGGEVNKDIFDKAGEKHGVDPGLLRSIAQAESGGRTNAVSSKGARGIMQLMPGTAKMLGVKDPMDKSQSVHGAAKYMRQLLDRYDGDTVKAVAAYNAGPGRVDKSGGVPRIRETVNYVNKVLPDADIPSLPTRRRVVAQGIKPAIGAMSMDSRDHPIPGIDQTRSVVMRAGIREPAMQASPMLGQPRPPTWTPFAVDPGTVSSTMLPQAGTVAQKPVTSSPAWQNVKVPAPTYTIKRGDTLSRIAQQHGRSISELMEANPGIKDANRIYAGDALVIPGGVDIQPAQVAPMPTAPQAVPINQWSRDLEAARANPATQAVEPVYPVESVLAGGGYGAGVTKLVGRGIDLTRRANAAEKAAQLARREVSMQSAPSFTQLAKAFKDGGKVDPNSITDYMKASGYGATFKDRQRVYEAIFREPYKGTEQQNVELLQVMESAKQDDAPAIPPGERIQMKGGGDVDGRGSETSDSVPAWLSDGEYVVNAEAVKMPGVRRTLENINAAGLAKRYGVM